MICSGGMAGSSRVIGDSADFFGMGFGVLAPGTPGAGPEAGGGLSGPVDCAEREQAPNKMQTGRTTENLRKQTSQFTSCRLSEWILPSNCFRVQLEL